MSVLEGQKKEEKRKKSVEFVSKADIIAIRINQTASIICNHICFNAHIWKMMFAFRSHKKICIYISLFVVKHCNSKESKLTDAVSLFNSTAQLDQMSV